MSAPASLNTPPPESNYISYAMVGHADDTPSYARVEGGRVLVEVTLVPSADEVIVRLNTNSTDDGGFFMPLHYGQKVVIGFPGGNGTEGVIIGSVNDATWPFPSDVCGISAQSPVKDCPMFCFLKTAIGELIAIESGVNGDVLIHSGASVQVKPTGRGQILLTGKTHIGADYLTPPIGGTVGPAGEVIPGVAGTEYEPAPGTNVNLPPASPVSTTTGKPWLADGLMRFKDTQQSNAVVDADFWIWVISVSAALTILVTEHTSFKASGLPWIPALGPIVPLPLPPDSLTSHGASCSEHTASDR